MGLKQASSFGESLHSILVFVLGPYLHMHISTEKRSLNKPVVKGGTPAGIFKSGVSLICTTIVHIL